MYVRHCAPPPRLVHVYFIEFISQVKAALEPRVVPKWSSVFDEVLSLEVKWTWRPPEGLGVLFLWGDCIPSSVPLCLFAIKKEEKKPV